MILALSGLAIDVGRMFVVRGELQAFADAATLSAALELDDSGAGLGRARDAAAALTVGDHAMKWDMGSKAITAYSLQFARGEDAPDAQSWQDSPRDASGYRFVRIVVAVPVSLTLLRVLEGMQAGVSTVQVASVSGRVRGTTRLIE